jgi:hypothetical protein
MNKDKEEIKLEPEKDGVKTYTFNERRSALKQRSKNELIRMLMRIEFVVSMMAKKYKVINFSEFLPENQTDPKELAKNNAEEEAWEAPKKPENVL